MGKKLLAMLLAVMLVVGMLPMTAAAAECTGATLNITIVYYEPNNGIGYSTDYTNRISNRNFECVSVDSNHSNRAHIIQTKNIHPDVLGLSAYVKEGYEWKGWFMGDDSFANRVKNPTNGTFAKDTTATFSNSFESVYLVYHREERFTLSYDLKGGESASDFQAHSAKVEEVWGKKSASITIRSNEPTKANSTFKGWDTASAGTTVVYNPGQQITIEGDTTLYAVWEAANPDPEPVAPSAPTADDLATLLADKVTVDCTNAEVAHENKTYDVLNDTYTVGEVTKQDGTYTCAITLTDLNVYCTKYNTDYQSGHTLQENQGTKTITLTYDVGGNTWVAGDGVTIAVECTTPSQPTAPGKPENLAELLADVAVKVDCTNTQINPAHADETYEVLEGSYTGAETVSGNAENGYTYTVTVAPALYVAEYNKATPGHTLSPEEQSATITLNYSNGQWAVDEEGKEITFTVTCETPAVTYTVTYTDGVPDAEIFADQVTPGLTAGAATPAFDGGVPSRAGYVFTGWDPAVAAAVIADATYTARWKAIPAAPAGADLKAKVGVRLDCINTSKTHEDKNYELLDGTYTIGQVTYREGAFHSSITIKATEYIKKYNEYKSGHELAPSNVDTHVIPLIYVEDTGWKVDIQSSGMVFASFEIVCKNAAATTSTSSSSGDYDDVPKTGDESMLILRGFGATIAMMVAFAVILAKKNRAC